MVRSQPLPYPAEPAHHGGRPAPRRDQPGCLALPAGTAGAALLLAGSWPHPPGWPARAGRAAALPGGERGGWLWARHRVISNLFLYALHASDILWPIVITYFARGPIAPSVQLYSFAILAAAFRWGFPEAVMTALAGSGVLQMEAFILRESPTGLLESNRLLVRCAYLLALGYMAGTLGENEKERRAERGHLAAAAICRRGAAWPPCWRPSSASTARCLRPPRRTWWRIETPPTNTICGARVPEAACCTRT